jgi:Ca-activated chloride channel family protein
MNGLKKSIGKKYLQKNLTAGSILVVILFGFLSGNGIGNMIFSNTKEHTVKITMVYSSEKSAWIAATQSGFLEYWDAKRAENPNLPKISLDFLPYGSGESLIALLNNEITPTIWSPASNIWIPILNSKYEEMTESDYEIAPNFTRIIYSPMVIAGWENYLSAHPIDGLMDLHDLIMSQQGSVKMAHTDPRTSNSGFMATLMMVSSKLNIPPENMELKDLSNQELIKWMTELQSACVMYGKSTGFLALYMYEQGLDALHFSILYENLVIEYSEKIKERYGQKLIAVYPEEGCLLSDHPFCVLNAPWVSEVQRMVANDYINYLSKPENLIKAIETGFRTFNHSLLDDPVFKEEYRKMFNEKYGVTSDPTKIKELITPSNGEVISRIPDLWLLTRNKA